MNYYAKQTQFKPNLSLPKGDQTQPVVSLPVLSLPVVSLSNQSKGSNLFSISNGVYGSGYLRKLRHCIIKESLVAFAEITFPALVAVKKNPVFYTAAATDSKVSADKTFVTKTLLGPGKISLFIAGGKFFYRRFKNIAQLPFRLYEKVAAETIAGMLDDDITAALFIERANRMFAAGAIAQYRVKVANAQLAWAIVIPAAKSPAQKFAVLGGRN